MTKYRIIKSYGKFRVQYKWIFGWANLMSIGESYIEFNTQEEAERKIEEIIRKESDNGTVVKEY